jgi:hypothetical protein
MDGAPDDTDRGSSAKTRKQSHHGQTLNICELNVIFEVRFLRARLHTVGFASLIANGINTAQFPD